MFWYGPTLSKAAWVYSALLEFKALESKGPNFSLLVSNDFGAKISAELDLSTLNQFLGLR